MWCLSWETNSRWAISFLPSFNRSLTHLSCVEPFNWFWQEIEGLKSLIDEAHEDKDMREMAAEELGQASQEEERLRYMLLKSLLPKDDADERDSILEVRAGSNASFFVS